MHFWGIRALAAASGADMTIGVMCTLGGAQATEKVAQFGLFLMFKLRSEEHQPNEINKSPPDMGPSHTHTQVGVWSSFCDRVKKIMELVLFNFSFELAECFLLFLRIVKSAVRSLLQIRKRLQCCVKFQ